MSPPAFKCYKLNVNSCALVSQVIVQIYHEPVYFSFGNYIYPKYNLHLSAMHNNKKTNIKLGRNILLLKYFPFLFR